MKNIFTFLFSTFLFINTNHALSAFKILEEINIEQQIELQLNPVVTNDTSEIQLITNTLMDYIEGTANGEPDRIKNAFHSDLNLYTVADGNLRTRNGQKYISIFEDGKKYNRLGRIISIDFENDAAMAKIEVVMPDMKRVYTDYLLLLKLEAGWKIIHKSYTYRAYPD